jgi:hypothetical protein
MNNKPTAEELQIQADHGRQAVRLMTEHPFFKDVLLPALEEDIDALEKGLMWRPGVCEKTAESIAHDRIWKSGILHGIAQVWVKLNKFKNDGLEAEKLLGLQKK